MHGQKVYPFSKKKKFSVKKFRSSNDLSRYFDDD